ncbi:MAG: LytTR family transcriptional regulator DNA-binding domain-containing protein [Lachnospiraceae bacterium]|nr:LytTR family transcriptional regulator DNA-binding domain-containing protein [Lachnospiraceae bacterium]
MKVVFMQVKVKTVDRASEERAEIHAVSITKEIRDAINLLEHNQQSIPVTDSEATMLCPLSQIYYFDSVDNHTFVYTKDNCYKTKYRLYELEAMLSCDFFRCSKSMIINIRKIASVKAEINARMRAVLLNGEAVIISRNYVKDLKEKLGI